MKVIRLLDWYFTFLEQDWCIGQVVKVTNDVVTVNYHGLLWSFGTPVYEKDIPIEHFTKAFHRSVDDDWSREYHPDTFDGIFYNPKGEMG